MKRKKPMSIEDFLSKFPNKDEEAAISYFIKIRYDGILTCPHCGATDKVYRCHNRLKACRCKSCDSMFSPFEGTIFEKSDTPLWKWFFAIYLLISARKGVSSLLLHGMLGVTLKTAWRMLQQIRLAMEDKEPEIFSGEVEMDETYIGGKPQRYPKSRSTGLYLPRPERKRGRGTDHSTVIGIKDRKSGHVFTQVMPFEPSVKGKDKRLSWPQIKAVIDERIEPGTDITTDEFKGYVGIDREERVALWLIDDEAPPPRHYHHTVCHKAGRFTDGRGHSTNGIESHWALLKRGFYGTYHSWSDKYEPRYLDEFRFRQNTRDLSDSEVFDLLLKRCILKTT